MDAAHMKRQIRPRCNDTPSSFNKWEVLKDLSTAQARFGLRDRDLAVLQALLSFHPGTDLAGTDSGPVVFPSNRVICERLNGMPCSTMRRHLGNLVLAGVILRRDSPNGKRYARHAGSDQIAFGFDLSPLRHRVAEIAQAAEDERAEQARFKTLREAVSLMRRDLVALSACGETEMPGACNWTRLADLAALTGRALRRKLTLADLEAIRADLGEALAEVKAVFAKEEAEELSTSAAANEQHIQTSNINLIESEPEADNHHTQMPSTPANTRESATPPPLPLQLVLSACPEIQSMSQDPVRRWGDLERLADLVCPMMGISRSVWSEAREKMGSTVASVVIAAMLQRFSSLRSPGGYLRSLAAKASDGRFSCGPMVMALTRQAA